MRQARVRFSPSLTPSCVDRHAHGGDEAPGRRPARIGEVVAWREAGPADAASRRLALDGRGSAPRRSRPSRPRSRTPRRRPGRSGRRPSRRGRRPRRPGRRASSRCVSCFTSKLPPFSRGGSVRRPWVAAAPRAGHRAAGVRAAAPSRRAPRRRPRGAVHAATWAARGRHAGDAHEGRAGDADAAAAAARSPSRRAMFQCTRNGVVMTSRRKPRPGMMRAERPRLGHDVEELDLQQVARAGRP